MVTGMHLSKILLLTAILCHVLYGMTWPPHLQSASYATDPSLTQGHSYAWKPGSSAMPMEIQLVVSKLWLEISWWFCPATRRQYLIQVSVKQVTWGSPVAGSCCCKLQLSNKV